MPIMSCRTFEKKGYLYLSGELSVGERRTFENHLERCAECREILAEVETLWNRMEKLPLTKPDRETRNAIFAEAKRERKVSSVPHRLRALWQFDLPKPRLLWGIPATVVVIVLMMLVLRPFTTVETSRMGQEAALEWQDDFMAEADWLDQELDRVESGTLLASYGVFEENDFDSEDWLSPVSRDLDWIRDKVENMVKTIYGI
jgi:hypothetical protein